MILEDQHRGEGRRESERSNFVSHPLSINLKSIIISFRNLLKNVQYSAKLKAESLQNARRTIRTMSVMV